MRSYLLFATTIGILGFSGCVAPPGTSQSTFAKANDPLPTPAKSKNFAEAQVEKVATIVDLDIYKGDDKTALTKTIAQQFDQTLLTKGYTVMNRSVVDSAVKELTLQRTSGLIDPDTAQRIGKAIGVKHIFVVSLTQADIVKQQTINQTTRNGQTDLVAGIINVINSTSGDTASVTLNSNLLVAETFETLWSVTDSRTISLGNNGHIKNAISQTAGRIAAAIPENGR